MSRPVLDPGDLSALKYIVTHVFCPLQLPDGDDHSVRNDRSLAAAVASAARLYADHISEANTPQWRSISGMLDNLQSTAQFECLDRFRAVSQLNSMRMGDVLAFLIRAQNVAVVFRKQRDVTIFESFELSPKAEDVMATQGKLICSYPGPAIEIPGVVFDDKNFLSELANFLVHMNDDVIQDAVPTSHKAQSTVLEARDTTHPRYITELLTGILRSVGRPADVVRISKRVGDDVAWNNSKLPWRRSSLWLLVRVALQTSLDRCPLGHDVYKAFMLFFMCCLGQEKICADLPNDLLQFMSAKISRRLRKLGSSAPEWLSSTVLETCTSLRSILEERWRQVQVTQRVSPPWTPSQLDLTRDIQLSLISSGEYLHNSLANNDINSLNTLFNPEHRPRSDLDGFLSSDGAFFENAYRAEPHITLYDVERAVEQSIDAWVGRVTDNNEACVQLEVLENKYSSSALITYRDNPELLSVMLLTTIELWIALDKIAIKEIPMLADYTPEVPISLLEELLASKNGSLHRLQRAHQYLSHRHSHSQSRWSIFSTTTVEDSFAVRFYRRSSRLQGLKAQIEEVARREACEKVDELERTNTRYAELQRKAANADHEFDTNWYGARYHVGYCSKCSFETELRNMQIAVHEWPLPADQLPAEAVVFELDCPISFNMWRAATFHLLLDLCSPPVEPQNPYIQLNQYGALKPYLVQHPRSRISLGSDTKPFVVTHYSQTSIPTTRGQVCVNNGLKFYGFDSHTRIPVSEALGRFEIRTYCTYQLPSGSYQSLQKYVDTASHTSNEVVANQADCHKDLSIHEFMAFGHLRSGGLLQWLNILRELRGRPLSFHRHEVHMLLAQAVSQVGSLENTGWTWHQEIHQPSFCYAILGELESLLRDVEANWLEAVTMDTISFLLRRLLASSPDRAVSLEAIRLLRIVRGKVFSWVEELSAKLTGTPEDEEYRGFLRDAAAICRSTFDVDPEIIGELLHSAEDIEVLLSSAVLIHDHTPSKVSCLSTYSRLLLDRDRRLSLVLESVVSHVIQTDSSDQGINLAVSRVWPDYRPGSRWTALQNPNSRWFTCTTAPAANQCSQVVHFNLLDGSLLVNGKPLGRLPNEILRHPLYNLIFGEQVLDVIPGDLPGMDYSTRGKISDHQVYFSLRDKDLVIRARRSTTNNSETIELIPQGKLEGDLPAVLIEGHTHWLNLSTSVMEIRPLDSLWKGSSENWEMDCTLGRYRIRKGRELLIDIRSPSWAMVSGLLKPLDIPQNLLVTVSPLDSDQPSSPLRLSVGLPRYDLSFFVDEDGDLQSHNLRGMVYDENQSIGTLFGLVNRLVLRPKLRDNVNANELIPRCVLIPDGAISFRVDGHHVRVEIDTRGPALQRITYHVYRVDTDLGCLIGNVSLTNKLYCAYLHALTSGCSIDPLTGRSGTEEALSLLRSASCWSIMKFGSRDAELLGLIASICPSRTWYPKHLKCMQVVEWLDLPVNSQHHELYVVSRAIKEHYEKVQLFHESQSSHPFEEFPLQDDHLLGRSARRAAYLFPSRLPGQPSGEIFDAQYSARDLVGDTSGEYRAYTAAGIVHRRTANLTTRKDILDLMESWTRTVSGDSALSLQYDGSWLTPDLPLIWLKMYDLLRRSNEEKWFQLLFSLPAMAYAKPKLADLVPLFVAFATDLHFRLEDPPRYNSYNLSIGYRPSSATLRNFVSNSAHSYECSPESTERAQTGETIESFRERQFRMYNHRRNLDTDTTVDQLLNAWPCDTLPRCSLNHSLYDVANLTPKVQSHFSSCYHNLKLKEHVTRVQNILDSVHSQVIPTPIPQYSFHPSQSIPSRVMCSFTVDQLFSRPAPSLQAHDRLPRYTANVGNTSPPGPAPLHQLIARAEVKAENSFQRQYVSALRTSAECFRSETTIVAHGAEPPTAQTLETHYDRCRASYIEGLRHLGQHLGPRSRSERALEQSGQWPRITAHTLFRSLASSSPIALSDDWKRCLITLTLLALELQRARRLLRLHLDDLHDELRRELQNEGCDGWDAAVHPDWLLIQLQSNFLVRRVQAEVAKEMITPSSGNNTAMQLNMGEGKSSVIVPIVVVVLADGTQLVRVIVPKALTAQTFRLLTNRLGGLVNRRIYYIPFSRSLEVNHQKATALREVMSECMKERGILVVQPEHVLSLRLVSVEKQLTRAEDGQLANLLLEFQRWLHSHSRDILDESDEILHVRYQLVYTIGDQQHMEGFPERWTTTEQVLSLVKKHASSLQKRFPLGVEYECGPSGSFPHLRILHADAGEKLISWIVQDVLNGLLSNFSLGQLRSSLSDAIRIFISCSDVPPRKIPIGKGVLSTNCPMGERRWRVDYGLAPTRTMLAVPYRAKDVPAQRAEFGHPDIAIILTCLSYYYGGLSEEQLRTCFEILLKQDDPSLDYDLWVRECSDVPESLQTLRGINVKSSEQWKDSLLPLFSRNRATIDFYLSSVVFPKEAKEFPSKLSCSGWDLAEKKDHVLTGFSGTNDGQYLLPLHITQRDPDHQRGTNAKVLSYLLQPENRHYMCMTHENGERRKTQEFLEMLAAQKPEIRVLLDVGAQMLDLQNYELAQAWLDVNREVSAAIYFNEDDELTVRTRDGNTQLLLSSPFAQQLDQCVVYLDDAHTRGTDIKFPSGFRAAVTLGPKVTKDRLVQGCMRMRKLGHGHSVMFFAPLEIDRRIRSVAGKDNFFSDVINTMDILHWVIRETCEDIQQRAPHWAQQGIDHTSRYAAWTSFCRDGLSPEALSEKWLQPEAKKLEDLYGPHNNSNHPSLAASDIGQHCIKLGILSLHDVSMDEEQEREVVHEAERERQVERPPKVPPASHSIHQDVVAFVGTGIVCANTKALRPAFETLDVTSAATSEAHVWSPFMLATTDFQTTVSSSGKLDEYLRPVQWVVSGKGAGNDSEMLVILSPYEANCLMPRIRSSDNVHLHLYTPRITKSMKPCDDLALYSIPAVSTWWTPPWPLVDQLNVFSGQLYLKDYETYIRLCRFLCVYAGDLQGEEGIEVGCDGFILPNNRPRHTQVVQFQSTPIASLRTLTGLRRKGMRFGPTHMGKLLDGRLLFESDFEGYDSDSVRSQILSLESWLQLQTYTVLIKLGEYLRNLFGCPITILK